MAGSDIIVSADNRPIIGLIAHYREVSTTDKITSETLDRIIGTMSVGIEAFQLDGDILFPGLYRYIFDENGNPIRCSDD